MPVAQGACKGRTPAAMSSIHPVLHFRKRLEPAIDDLLCLIFADVPIFGEAILGLAIEQTEVQGFGLRHPGRRTPWFGSGGPAG